MLIPERNKYASKNETKNFKSHINQLTSSRPRNKNSGFKRGKSQQKVKKYDINTIISNRSEAMNLKDLFIDESMK